MAIETIRVPDLGGAEEVEVIEISVAVGDTVSAEQTLVVLESEKAAMELPAPRAGRVVKILVKEGDKFKKPGAAIVELDLAAEAASGTKPSPDVASAADKHSTAQPIGASELASATMPATKDKSSSEAVLADSTPASSNFMSSVSAASLPSTMAAELDSTVTVEVYAGPAVRQLARELGVDLSQVKGSGPRGRLLKEDVQTFVKQTLQTPVRSGAAIPVVPPIDFSQFGPIETLAMTKVQKLTAINMHRSWLNVPHVTQFDDADITELEAFRGGLKADAERRGVKLTPLPFLLKACAAALANNPEFNRSLHPDGAQFIQKQYIHIGMAVDTPRGLLVPVIRDVDKKGLWQLAEEAGLLATKARDGKLALADMQGACFTITSLGAQGGNGFTPIVNTPEVGILGVSRLAIRPVWMDGEFRPRQLLPLSLSYDHRAVNGADGGRFLTYLVAVLGDIRRLLL